MNLVSRHIIIWAVASMASIFLACEEKQIPLALPEPQIIAQGFTAEQIVQEVGKSVQLSFQLEAAAGLDLFVVEQNNTVADERAFTNQFTATYEFNFTIPTDATIGTLYEFDFILTDKRGRTITKNFVIRVGQTFTVSEVTVGGETLTQLKGRVNGNYTFESSKKYLVDSIFSIEDNGTLTIEAGTEVYFKTTPNPLYVSSIVIARGSRIQAVGTKDSPIVFTSDKALTGTPATGDWGGLYIFGNAPTNQGPTILEEGFRYGGTATTENSGTLRYVRIEYSGKGGVHGLHLFGVGSGTVVENVQVFRNYNTGFRIKGGNVRLKKIAAIGHGGYGIWAEHGWRGFGQFWIFQTDVMATLVPINYWNQARSIEMRNDENQFLLTPRTQFQIANVTCIGNGFTEGVNNGTRRGIRIRRGATGVLQNAIVTAFPDDGVRIEDLDLAELGVTMIMDNQRTWNNRVDFNNEALTFFFESGNFNITKQSVAGIGLTNYVGSVASPFNPTALGSWFENAPFIGAVESSNDWTADGNWFKNLDGTIR